MFKSSKSHKSSKSEGLLSGDWKIQSFNNYCKNQHIFLGIFHHKSWNGLNLFPRTFLLFFSLCMSVCFCINFQIWMPFAEKISPPGPENVSVSSLFQTNYPYYWMVYLILLLIPIVASTRLILKWAYNCNAPHHAVDIKTMIVINYYLWHTVRALKQAVFVYFILICCLLSGLLVPFLNHPLGKAAVNWTDTRVEFTMLCAFYAWLVYIILVDPFILFISYIVLKHWVAIKCIEKNIIDDDASPKTARGMYF